MNIQEVRDFCLSLPHATERSPFGPDTLSLEIGGKIFCLMDLSGQWQFYNIKVNPDFSIELRDRFSSVRPGYHMNKRHWISVDFDNDIPPKTEREILRHAYRCTAAGLTLKLRRQLGLDLNDLK